MSQLARLLGANASALNSALGALEAHSAHKAIDAILLGDLHESMARAVIELGLDPANSTGPEIYRALGNRFATDFEQVLKNSKFDEVSLKAFMKRSTVPPFWRDTLWTGALYNSTPLSLNVFDVFDNFKLNSTYSTRQSAHFKCALADELLRRYKEVPGVSQVLLDKLERVIIGSNSKPKRKNK
ncbi:MAG: hypothetical protein LBL84_00070 [Candidatus Nomurabacteria bacterium]|jgi:hypothetical protein|nr:hypothetical protein [Candidatus Nomurabacteria bacterium]